MKSDFGSALSLGDSAMSNTAMSNTVATTNDGQITGNQQGFSTLTIQSGDVVATATITVVEIILIRPSLIGPSGHCERRERHLT